MKRNYRAYLASLIVILAGALFALAGCGKVVTGISVKNLDSIQSVYVKGQDMDLGSISLSVRSNNGETTVTLADSDVRVSGYDKNTLGKQRVTAIYGGKSVSFNVTVVERIVAENYDVNYFIGDEFNRNKGRLKITENDGTSFTVPISSEEVTVFGFDSSEEAKPLIVDVIYEKGSKKYFGTLSVNIYSAGASAVILPHILGGMDDVARRNVTWEQIVAHTDVVLAFGGIPATGAIARTAIPLAQQKISASSVSNPSRAHSRALTRSGKSPSAQYFGSA